MTPIFASDFSGLAKLFIAGPAALLLLMIIALLLANKGNRWSLALVALLLPAELFLGFLVLSYHDEFGPFFTFWLLLPLVTGVLAVILLLARRRASRNNDG